MSGTDFASIGATGGITGSFIRTLSRMGPTPAVRHNEAVSTIGEQPSAQSSPAGPAYVTSVVALAFGVLLAVGVSALFGLLGWGGELASQTAGAASGAAPLILDGVRQRRARERRQDLLALSRGRQVASKILVASLFGFGVLFVDSVVGYAVVNATQEAIRVAGGDPSQWVRASTVVTAVVVLPLVLAATLSLSVMAGHRLGEQRRRWILFGMGLYGVLRVLHLTVWGPLPGVSAAISVAGVVLTVGILSVVALIGAWWARRTQAVFNATAFFRRLPEEDQEAALALLGETVAARRSSPGQPPAATPPAAAPSGAVDPSARPRREPR
jgi:hypothetical protein